MPSLRSWRDRYRKVHVEYTALRLNGVFINVTISSARFDSNICGLLQPVLYVSSLLGRTLCQYIYFLHFIFQGYGNKGITLYDIRAELSCRYKDLRVPYRVPNTEEVFNLLTKETPETFYIGNTHCITGYTLSYRTSTRVGSLLSEEKVIIIENAAVLNLRP